MHKFERSTELLIKEEKVKKYGSITENKNKYSNRKFAQCQEYISYEILKTQKKDIKHNCLKNATKKAKQPDGLNKLQA